MVDLFKSTILAQYQASLRMLKTCIDKCPDDAWDAPVCNHTFCESVFHTLFFTDAYLGPNIAAVREQQFHKDNPDFFRDYEELQPKKPEYLYDRPTVLLYLDHCRKKAQQVVMAETTESLAVAPSFDWQTISRAELHIYNIRHIQHHAAQLSLRLRLNDQTDVPWCKSGWAQ